MGKKTLCMVLTAVLAGSLLLSGCQKSPEGNQPSSGESDVKTSEANEEIVLTFPCIWVGADSKAEVFGKMVSDFNAEYSGRYRIQIEDQTDYGAYKDKLRTLISTGNAPDIFTFSDYSDMELYSQSGKLMDLSGFLSGTDMAGRFQDNALTEAQYNGKNYCFPYESAVISIMFNERLLKSSGVSEIPESIESLWTMCETLKEKGIAPLCQMTSEKNKAWTSMLWYSYLVAACGGKDVYNHGLEDEAFVEAAELLKKMYDYTTSDAIGADATVVNGHFFNERAAVCPNGSWILGRIKTEGVEGLYDQLVLSPGLSYKGQNGGVYVSSVQAYLAAGKQDDPEREEAVKAFFEYVTRPEKVLELANSSGSLFAINIDDTKLTDPLQAKIVSDSKAAPFLIGTFASKVPVTVSNAFSAALEEMFLDEITPQQFVQKLQDAWT